MTSKSYLLSGSINDLFLEKAIHICNDEVLEIEGIQKNIYISSNGGEIGTAFALVDLFSKYNVKLISHEKICSAGFYVFFKSKCSKEILDSAIGMWHQAELNISINNEGKPKYYECIFKKKDSKRIGFVFNELLKELGFTNKEKLSYKRDEDVYFSAMRMREMLEHQSIWLLSKQ